MTVRHIRRAILRKAFRPALRMFRDTLIANPQASALRAWAAYFDATLAREDPAVARRPVQLSACDARWFDIEGADPRKVILYLHGGAFVTETPRLHGAFLARLGRACGMCGLMPHYRLAPEHPFPAAPDDALSAYRWLLERGHAAHDIVVAGDSAGGNLALGLLQRLQSEGLPQPACAVVLSPITDGSFSGASIRRNQWLDPMFTARGFEALVPLYLPDATQRCQSLASPLFGDCNGLPPILLQVGSSELLLDDSVRFAQRCPQAQLQVWHGAPHVFPIFDFLAEAQPALNEMAAFIALHAGDHPEMPTAEPD